VLIATTIQTVRARFFFDRKVYISILAASSSSNDSKHSDASTPPTEVSNPPDSPQFMPLQDTEDIRRRREQSDRASQLIGTRLLQGWAMLADECPGPTCYGVPLVRPPKAGGEKDPRKVCLPNSFRYPALSLTTDRNVSSVVLHISQKSTRWVVNI